MKIGHRKLGHEFMRHQSWSNICDPHLELICRNKWHPGTSKISTPPEIAVGTNFHAQYGTKTTSVFLPFKFCLLTIKRHSATRKHLFLYPQGGRLGLTKPKKDKHWHLSQLPPAFISIDLTIKSDSVLTSLIGKDGKLGWSM